MNNLAQGVPASTSSLVPVDFQGTTLYLVEHAGQPYVFMKPVVEAMGMNWASQHIKLTSNPRFWIAEIAIQIPGDDQSRDAVCLPLRKLPGWLYSIQPNKVAPNLRPRVVAYQNECDDVLWKHWSGQPRPVPAPAIPATEPRPIFSVAFSDGTAFNFGVTWGAK